MGLENISPDNLLIAKKGQNKTAEYCSMLQKWHEHGVITCSGYIISFPADTKESILANLEIIKQEFPLEILEFSFLTPSLVRRIIKWRGGEWMDPDLNKYDLNHGV